MTKMMINATKQSSCNDYPSTYVQSYLFVVVAVVLVLVVVVLEMVSYCSRAVTAQESVAKSGVGDGDSDGMGMKGIAHPCSNSTI